MTVSYEEELQRSGKIVVTNVGVSMRPLIKQGRDIIYIGRKEGRLRKYDVPLYKRKNGDYVLHRIVKVCDESYVILGDNCISKEYGITDDQIIGVMTSLVRNGKEIDLNGTGYKLYVRVWCITAPVRILLKKTGSFIKRTARKILRR